MLKKINFNYVLLFLLVFTFLSCYDIVTDCDTYKHESPSVNIFGFRKILRDITFPLPITE